MNTLIRLRDRLGFLAGLGLSLLALPSAQVSADTTDLSLAPPDVTVGVAPNIALTFDDSGSMGSTHLPDGLDDQITDDNRVVTRFYFSSNSNSQYYNPNIVYTPPLMADGVSRFPNSSYTNAPRDGICYWAQNKSKVQTGSAASCTTTAQNANAFFVNLSTSAFDDNFANFTITARIAGDPGVAAIDYKGMGIKAGGFYYNCPTVNSSASCTVVYIPDSQKTNFANWYSYYRTRNLTARSAIANVFAGLSSNIRVVWQTLNAGTKIVGGTTTFDPFTGDARANFFKWLYAVGNYNGTDSRTAIGNVGKIFTSGRGVTNSKNPYWEADSGNPDGGTELSCRLNYSLLVTDGYWNNGTSGNVPDSFGQKARTLPDGVAYGGTNGDPESAIYWNAPATNFASLADIAFYYWATNLRPDLQNSNSKPKLNAPPSFTNFTDRNGNAVTWDGTGAVPSAIYFNPSNDPATWPHVVQFMISLGVNGVLSYPNDYAALRNGSKAWPQPVNTGNTNPSNLDDTWHAAINSRGQYFSARDPATLSAALGTLINRILGRNTTAAPGALSTAVLTGNGVAYQTGYNSANYSGRLTANSVDVNGNVSPTALWSAGDLLTKRAKASDTRVILTSTAPGAGNAAAFTAAGAGTALAKVDASITSDMIAYLRGSPSKEGTTFRTRASTLGAIIDSPVVYVSFPASGYTDTFPANAPESAVDSSKNLLYSYEKFVSDHAKRAPTIYVGANDGMLHAFDATLSTTDPASVDVSPSPGAERWAYVPNTVYDRLSYGTSLTNFQFRPSVDGSLVSRDVFFSGSSNKGWHTILVGGLRLGGRGIYALDITNATASEGNPGATVLWEFNNNSVGTDGKTAVGANLGYTYGKPNIGRLANGKWVVLVPSGYFPSDTSSAPFGAENQDSASARTQSSLFVLDAQTGAVIRELITPVAITSYGLGSAVMGDYNNDQIDDVAFAGDLVGNLWRFDLSNADPSKWSVSLLFQPAATSTSTTPGPGDQPITVMPRLFADPTSSYFMVVFGTGKYLGASDNVGNSTSKVQSVYGIRDPGPGATTTITGRATLVAQTLQESSKVRAVSTNPVPATNAQGEAINGWYLDLNISDGTKQTNQGERVVVDATALFDSGRVIITSLIPGNNDPCNPIRRGAIMVLDAATGGAASGVSVGNASFGAGYAQAGIRIDNVPISGALPAATPLGGGRIVIPGLTLTNADGSSGGPFGIGDAIWRRRSWRELNNAY